MNFFISNTQPVIKRLKQKKSFEFQVKYLWNKFYHGICRQINIIINCIFAVKKREKENAKKYDFSSSSLIGKKSNKLEVFTAFSRCWWLCEAFKKIPRPHCAVWRNRKNFSSQFTAHSVNIINLMKFNLLQTVSI